MTWTARARQGAGRRARRRAGDPRLGTRPGIRPCRLPRLPVHRRRHLPEDRLDFLEQLRRHHRECQRGLLPRQGHRRHEQRLRLLELRHRGSCRHRGGRRLRAVVDNGDPERSSPPRGGGEPGTPSATAPTTATPHQRRWATRHAFGCGLRGPTATRSTSGSPRGAATPPAHRSGSRPPRACAGTESTSAQAAGAGYRSAPTASPPGTIGPWSLLVGRPPRRCDR